MIYSEMLGFITVVVKNQSLKNGKSHSEMVFPGILPSAYIISLKQSTWNLRVAQTKRFI